MPTSVTISEGARDFQIYQQINGYADIYFKGTYVKHEGFNVWARVVSEDTNMDVISWQQAVLIDDSNYEITVKDVPAGGLYRIETCLNPDLVNIEWGARGDMVFHVGVGDVYVIAGQSNSSGYGKTPVYDPSELGVHLLKNSEQWDIAAHPMNDATNTVHEVNAECNNSGHSPYLHFAKMLKKNLNYPIGLIQTSLGGSPLFRWEPNENGDLYHNMIDVIKRNMKDCKIAGVLWYQGCSDCCEGACDTYLERFETFVEGVRKECNDEKLPIYTVQLNRVIQPSDEGDVYWSKVREAQRLAANVIDNVYVVPAHDLGLSDLIHNNSASNLIIGERLANMALGERFGKNVYSKAPDIKSVEVIAENRIRLHFDNVKGIICHLGIPQSEIQFKVENDNEIFSIANYGMLDDYVELELDRNMSGNMYVSFCYGKNPLNQVMFDRYTGLPILAFYKFKF